MSKDPKESEPASPERSDATPRGPHQSPELAEALAEAEAAVGRADQGSAGAQGAPTTAAEAVTEALLDARRELEQVLEQTQKEAEQLRERWMRAAADLENYRRRAAKEREDMQRFGSEKLLRDFLPVLDDLERASAAVEGAEPSTGLEVLLGGVRLVHKKFLATLEKHGVSTFESEGEPFNPERHDAVQQAPSPYPTGSVAKQVQRGFLLHDRLLRPAFVVVSLGPEGGEEGAG